MVILMIEINEELKGTVKTLVYSGQVLRGDDATVMESDIAHSTKKAVQGIIAGYMEQHAQKAEP